MERTVSRLKYIFECLDSQNDFDKWMRVGAKSALGAESFLYQFDEDTLKEGERLNIILCPIKWEVEHECLSDWLSHELYLYYQQLVNGELDDVIDPEERQDVVRILTECFNKAFPKGLE